MLRVHARPVGTLLCIALSGVLAGCSHSSPAKRTIPAASVPVVTAKTGTVSPQETLGGIIIPYFNVQIQSSLVEPTDAVYVNEGDHVHKGQVLARLDTADLEAQLRSDLGTAASDGAKVTQTADQAGLTIIQNANTINAAEAAVRQAEATLAIDTLNLKRDAALLTNGYVSQQTYDTQNTLVKNDVQSVRTAQVTLVNDRKQVEVNGTLQNPSGLQAAQVAAARADQQTALGQADNIRASIAKAVIVSPVDGVIVNRNLNVGEYPGSRQIFTVQENDRVYAALNGSSSQVVGVSAGAPTEVASTDKATLKAAGKVVGVLDQVTPGSTNFIVKVLLENPGGVFHAGMVVSGRVTKPSTTGTRVPVTAFVDTTDTTVQIVDNGVVKTVPVTQIASDGANAIVQGLHGGETVIANGQLGLSDGQAVQPQAVAER
jgi:multidrug efflux pump subunit AcrA (membrane-fusion protein)